jgi:hypothetical protein
MISIIFISSHQYLDVTLLYQHSELFYLDIPS